MISFQETILCYVEFPAVSVPIALALAVRAATIVALHRTPFTQVMVGDSLGYLETADRLLSGGLGEVGVFFQSAPLYPLLLAALQAVAGPGWLPVVLLQALIGSLACGAIARIAELVFPDLPAAPWIAGMAAALYGPLVFHDAEILPASLAASLLAFALLVLAGSGGWRRGAAGSRIVRS